MAFNELQRVTVGAITDMTIRQVVEAMDKFHFQVHVPDAIYSRHDRMMSHREVLAFLQAHVTDPAGRALKRTTLIDLGITRFTSIVGTSLAVGALRTKFAGEPNHARAWALVREMASWCVDPQLMTPDVKEAQRRMYANIFLRWIENVKRQIYGLPMDMQQFVLSLWGASGAFKSSTAKKLLEPLKPYVWAPSDVGRLLIKHEGAVVAQNAAVWLDDAGPLPNTQTNPFKQFVFADEWVADGKGKTAVQVPIIASFLITHNHEPSVMYPDPAMNRRLACIAYPRALPEEQQADYAISRIVPFPALELWQAVDHVNRQSSLKMLIQHRNGSGALQDEAAYFMQHHTLRSGTGALALADLFSAFRARAAEGGWDARSWTDRRFGSRLRELGYQFTRISRGMAVRGIILGNPASTEPAASEPAHDLADSSR